MGPEPITNEVSSLLIRSEAMLWTTHERGSRNAASSKDTFRGLRKAFCFTI